MLIPISAYAVSTIPVINALWTQYPKSKNKVTSITVVFFSIGAAFWDYLFTKSVNP